jgi:uncharacterized membrane protein
MKRSSLALVVYLLLVFLSGILAGGFAYGLYIQRSMGAKATPRTPAEYRSRYVQEMRSRLKLSEDQVRQLNAIMDASRLRYREFREKQKPELEAIDAERVKQLHAMLTDPQRREYEQMRQEREQRRRTRKQ